MEDPVCIDANKQDQIIVLNHEYLSSLDSPVWTRRKEYPPEQLMNSSVAQLAECLLIYERFWHAEEISLAVAEQMRTAMRAADPPAMEQWTFWWYETRDEELFSHQS